MYPPWLTYTNTSILAIKVFLRVELQEIILLYSVLVNNVISMLIHWYVSFMGPTKLDPWRRLVSFCRVEFKFSNQHPNYFIREDPRH